MAKTLLSFVFLVVVGEAHAWTLAHSLTPLYHTQNSAVTDHFYTVSEGDRNFSISCCGYVDRGIAAWMLPSYLSFGDPNASAFRRFYKYLPQREHFYTQKPQEITAVRNLGYVDEGHEGHILNQPMSGSTPMYRLSRFYPSTGDLQHLYTTSLEERSSLLATGVWASDGVQGYVFAHPVATPDSPVYYVKCAPGQGCAVPSWIHTPTMYEYNVAIRYGFCFGYVNVYINGVFISRLTSSYGRIPGTFNTEGCYVPFSPPVGYAGQMRLEFSGFGFAQQPALFNYVTYGYQPPAARVHTVP